MIELNDQLRGAFAIVDRARAMYAPSPTAPSILLGGHRISGRAGEMFWALPGGNYADGVTLLSRDKFFRVLHQPSVEDLRKLQSLIHEVEDARTRQ